jgi:hypothetical protein
MRSTLNAGNGREAGRQLTLHPSSSLGWVAAVVEKDVRDEDAARLKSGVERRQIPEGDEKEGGGGHEDDR